MRPRSISAMVIMLSLALALGGNLNLCAESSAQSDWSAPRTVYVPATGHTIDGLFLDVWRAWKGATLLGNPITEEISENGRIVQYFELARLEYWPDGDHEGNAVHLGDIGFELLALQLQDLEADGHAKDSPLAFATAPVDPRTLVGVATDRRFIETTAHTVRLGFRDIWEATGEIAYLGNPLTEEYRSSGKVFQFFERGQLCWDEARGLRKVPVGRQIAERLQLSMTAVAQGDLPTYSEDLFVPPALVVERPQLDPNAERWIEVNLSWQYLIAWQGDVRVIESYVSTGRSGFETPAGTFYILSKFDSEDMEGVIGGEYYNVPAVPWTMYFTNYGHALHGTYWHSNFGTPMSHGCVNLPTDVAEWLYWWAPLGTRVEIHY